MTSPTLPLWPETDNVPVLYKDIRLLLLITCTVLDEITYLIVTIGTVPIESWNAVLFCTRQSDCHSREGAESAVGSTDQPRYLPFSQASWTRVSCACSIIISSKWGSMLILSLPNGSHYGTTSFFLFFQRSSDEDRSGTWRRDCISYLCMACVKFILM